MYLSKTKYLIGRQCPKALWINYNNKALIPEVDAGTQAIFDQGHDVGHLAKQLFPNGIDLDGVAGIDSPIDATREALKNRKPVFEAALAANSCFARADILEPVGRGKWDIIEVKSSTQEKDVHIQDIAFQRYVYEGAGLKIRKCFLLLINNQYVRNGEIDPAQLLSKIDVTDSVQELMPEVEPKAKECLSVIQRPECPVVAISPHCSDPYGCALKDVCWSIVPDHSVFELRRGGAKAWELFNSGIARLEDIPADFNLSADQAIQVECQRTGEPQIRRDEIRRCLEGLEYPLYFLDFETVMPGVPLFNKSKPYGQIPFQFSLHVIPEPGAAPRHHSFLAEGRDDPRPAFLAELQRLLGSTGSIVGYNNSFELGRLKECAGYFPEYSRWVEGLLPRFFDLLDVFRPYHYYHPVQHGSASLKAVLPALTGKSYEDLEIQEGGTASREFLRVTFTDVPTEQRRKLREALETYCEQDTQALIDLLVALENLMKVDNG